ncbi:hypothetical protein RF11_05732 [Thelohanellus kitauei]|uniref:Retrotransposon gag domain-containing protein n=1 Tax=Thelohanellus kitauei TaxID=669202 RepID=A0A0C2MBW7_THEKT|nr:hypothetical protein RF11_05732 [Thelohanellus kitauei]
MCKHLTVVMEMYNFYKDNNLIFDAFNEEIEDWDNYISRFELKLKVNALRDISPRVNALKSDFLVSSFTAGHFQLLREQGDVCQAMASRYRKKRNPFVERREFYKCVKREDEDLRSFDARLRMESFHCHYGPTLCSMLQDPFIIGLNDTEVQAKLLGQFLELIKTLNDTAELSLKANSNQAAEVISSEIADVRNLSRCTAFQGICLRCRRDGYHEKGKICPAANSACYLCNAM